MRRFTLLLLLAVAACAPRAIIRHDAGAFAVRDYLKTAYETLAIAETDGDGHRIRAQLETRAAIDALGELGGPSKRVPYEGPATLAVALELLERTEPQMTQNVLAQTHVTRALAELRAALR
jgi:hypothetical protein